jgi:hypothetical protein
VAGSTWFLAALVTLLTWFPRGHAIQPNLDASAITGLHLSAVMGLDAGREVIFTYGPLGFLAFRNAIFDSTALWSALYIVAVRYTLCASLLWVARRNFPVLIAVPLAVAGALVVYDEELTAIAFLWSAAALGPGAPLRSERLAVYGSALLAGLAILVKPSVGVNVLAITGITVLALPGPRGRHLLGFVGTYALTVLALLLAATQSPLAFPDYIVNSLQLGSGYQTAFVLGEPSAGVLLIAGLLVAGGLAWTVYASAGLPGLQRGALIAMVAYYCYAEFKIGFTRFGFSGHLGRFTAAMMLPWFAFPMEGRVQRGAAAAAIVAIGALWFPWTSIPVDFRLDLRANADRAVSDIRGLVDAGERERVREDSRRGLRAQYGLDARALRLLHDQRVDAEPWEASLIWAYGLDWSPAPIFQALAANTPRLDRINAGWLSDPDGPTRIVRPVIYPVLTSRQPVPAHVESVDGRYAAYDTPSQTLAMLCNFAPLDTTPKFQILGRTEDRCGEKHELSTVTAGFDEPVPVPRPPGPDQIVLAEVDGIVPSRLELLRTSLYRALRRWISFGDGRRYQLTPLNAGEPLLLRAPPKADLPPPYALAPDAATISFERESGFPSPPDTVEITFTAMRVAPVGEGTVRGFS